MSWKSLSACLSAMHVQTHLFLQNNCGSLLPVRTGKPNWTASHIHFYTYERLCNKLEGQQTSDL